jgi:ABC-type amino acid transport substrate-binding protein
VTNERLERRLRSEPSGEPSFHLTGFIRRLDDEARGVARTGAVGLDRAVRSRTLAGLNLGAVRAVAVFLAVLLVLRAMPAEEVGPSASPRPSADLLGRVRASGVLRVAVRPDYPQATSAALGGFDIDVATAIASRLGYRVQIVPTPVGDMAAAGSSGAWDLAMPSSVLAAASPAFATSQPYYHFPILLIVPRESAARAAADLAGTRICVVAESAGAAWLSSLYDGPSSTTPVPPPAGAQAHTSDSDQACIDALVEGDVDAIVTSTLTEADLASRPSLGRVGTAVLTEPRTIVAARNGPDPTGLLAEVDRVLVGMRTDGLLADLSRSRFGGQDLTAP